MKLINKPKSLVIPPDKEVIRLTTEKVEMAILSICKNIDNLVNFDEFLVIVRGGMVPAIYLSHYLNKRNFVFFQGFKTNSNIPQDFSPKFKKICSKINKGKKYLIVEDIIFKGETIYQAIKYTEKNGGKIVGVCSLVMDEKFKNFIKKNLSIPLFVAFQCQNRKWIRFPWEKKIKGEVIPKIKKA